MLCHGAMTLRGTDREEWCSHALDLGQLGDSGILMRNTGSNWAHPLGLQDFSSREQGCDPEKKFSKSRRGNGSVAWLRGQDCSGLTDRKHPTHLPLHLKLVLGTTGVLSL